ncbi:hypothetical protein [Sulfitobacter sp.]|jgi:hypothetical protein|uniref:hypothetical protein n=1 Tax=Sulfitobacter sp. TaxID=1903071 RepID=UPI0039E36D5A
MKKYSITEADLPKRMRKFLADIDEGKVFSAQALRNSRAGVSSALRGLIETARSRQLPDKLGQDTAEAFLARLTDEGWQEGSLIGLKTLLRHYAYETDEGVDWALASSATDRRPLGLVFRAAHWAPFRALLTDIEASFTQPEIRMVDRWLRHKNAHVRVDEEMAERFSADATTFSKLSAIMTAIDPENPDNLVLQQVQRKRRQAASGYVKKAPKLPYHDLPEPFFAEMVRLFREASGLSVSRLKSMCSALRRLCSACESAQIPVGLTMEAAEAFVNDLFEDSDLELRSVAGYCDLLGYFAKNAGYPDEVYAALLEVHNAVKLEANTELRRKEHKLAQHPIDLVDVALTAHTLLDLACDQDDIRNRRRDYVLAGAIAMLSKLQLRSFDLTHGVVGREFIRDSEGWRVNLETSKTGTSIIGRLAPELTRYLDAVLLMDVSEAHLWSVYTRRIGTALFGNPAQGWTPFGKTWLWRNMTERLHHGPHIVRTLIYDAVAADAELDAAVAQALCGHGNFTSRKFYEVGADRHRRKAGIRTLGTIARGLDQEVHAVQHSW